MRRHYITAIHLRADGADWSVLQSGRAGVQRVGGGWEALPAPAGAEPASPEAPAPEAVALKAVAAGARGRVVLVLPPDQVLLRVLRLPATEDAELAGMVEFQAEKFAPFPLDAMVVGHEVLRRGADASLVLVAAARLDGVDRAGAALRAAGLNPWRVDAGVLGWWRVLCEAGRTAAGGCRAEVALWATGAHLLVLRDGEPLAFRTLSAGMGTPADAIELARELSVSLVAVELEHGALEAPTLTLWTTGGTPAPEWRDAFTATWGSPSDCVALSDLPPVSEGAARRAFEPGLLDLTPAGWRQTREQAAFRRRLLRIGAGLVGTWLLLVGAGFGLLTWEQQRVERLQAEREAVRRPALDVRDTRRRVFMVKHYLDNSGSALECLRELCTVLPAGVELTSFSYHKEEEVKLSGEAAAVGLVYEFKSKLDASAFFRDATLQGPREAPGRRTVFDVTLRLKEEAP